MESSTGEEVQPLLSADGIELDRHNMRLVVDGEPVDLRGKGFHVLGVLMARSGDLVTKQDLLDAVWDGRPHSDAVLTTAIKEVRKALGDSAREPRLVATVHGQGYRFLLPVAAHGPGEAPLALVPGNGQQADPQSAMPGPRRPWQWPAVAAMVAGAFAVVALVLGQQPADAPEAASSRVAAVAVLPFDDFSDAGADAWFADGLREELLHVLAASKTVRVAARTSSARFGNGDDARRIGEALGVTHFVEGSVRRDGPGTVRVTAQLIRTADGFHEWSASWDRELAEGRAVAVQRELSWHIGARVLPGVAAAADRADVPEAAYRAWLRGRARIDRRDKAELEAGVRQLREAVTLAPDFAPARAALVTGLLLAGSGGLLPVADAIAAAKPHAETALALDGSAADVLTAAAFLAIAERDMDKALGLSSAAVRAGPNFAPAHQRHAVVLGMLGRMDEAWEAIVAAQALDPLSPVLLANKSALALHTGRLEEALATAEFNANWNEGRAAAHGTYGRMLAVLGKYAAAIAQLELAMAAAPSHRLSTSEVADLYWRLGADTRAAAVAAGPAGWFGRSVVHAVRGDWAAALDEANRHRSRYYHGGPNALRIYVWAGQAEAAHGLVQDFLGKRDLAALVSTPKLPGDLVDALMVLEETADPMAETLHGVLAQRFAQRLMAEVVFGEEYLAGAQWFARQGDTAASLRWLQAATAAGFVLREVDVHPVFAGVRSDPAFAVIRARMAAVADEQLRLLDAGKGTSGGNQVAARSLKPSAPARLVRLMSSFGPMVRVPLAAPGGSNNVQARAPRA